MAMAVPSCGFRGVHMNTIVFQPHDFQRHLLLARDKGCHTEVESGPEPSAPPRHLSVERGFAAALAYGTVSAVWYLVGMALYLCSTTAATASTLNPLPRVLSRLAQAWVVTFAASQVTTPWRAAGALALSPVLTRFLQPRSPRTGRLHRLLPLALYAVGLAMLFFGGLSLLGVREALVLRT
jgi:hypothetical protein